MKNEQQMLINAMVLSATPKIIEFTAIFADLTETLSTAMTNFSSVISGKSLTINDEFNDFFSHELQQLVHDVLNSMAQHGEATTNAYCEQLETQISNGDLDISFDAAKRIQEIMPSIDFSSPFSADQVLALLSLKNSEYVQYLDLFNKGFEPILNTIQKDIDAIKAESDALEDEKASRKLLFVNTLKENNVEKLEEYIEQGADIQQKLENHDTPISIAAAHGSADVVNLLLKKGAIPHVQFPEKSALTIAIDNNSVNVLNKILIHGHECLKGVNWQELLPWTLNDEYVDLIQLLLTFKLSLNLDGLAVKAVEKSHHKLLTLCLDNGFDLTKGKPSDNLAVIALGAKNQEALLLLLNRGIDKNSLDFFDRSLLALAIENSNTSAMKVLMDKSAKIVCRDYYDISNSVRQLAKLLDITFLDALRLNLFDTSGSKTTNDNFLHFASGNESFGVPELKFIVEELKMDVNAVKNHSIDTPLSLTEDLDKIRYLISQGADVNHIVDGRPIIFSVSDSMIPVFIEAGADVNTVYNGDSLLHKAISNQTDYLGLLLSKGVDVTIQDKEGRTVLEQHIYKVEYLTPYMEALITAGVNLKKRTRESVPLTTVLCCLYGAGAIKKAAEKGYEFNEVDLHGNSTIMHACIAGNPDAVDTLAKLGVDVNKGNMFGVTALMHAIYECNTPVVRALLNNGADMTLELAGRDAMTLASEVGSISVLDIMKKYVAVHSGQHSLV